MCPCDSVNHVLYWLKPPGDGGILLELGLPVRAYGVGTLRILGQVFGWYMFIVTEEA